MSDTMRLDRILSNTGLYSRREAAGLISHGRVSVDGCIATSGGGRYDPEKVSVTVDEEPVAYRKYYYIMLNKPMGYISSTNDRRGKTVMELLDSKYAKLGLFPAGRLDKDSEGLLILTNDGEFTHNTLSPTKKINKKYFVEIDGTVSDEDIKMLAQGLVLRDGTKCLPAILQRDENGAFITVYEGKYHQVKRMMAALGKPVKYLKRVAIGGLTLDSRLKPGEYREMTDEIRLIFTQ